MSKTKREVYKFSFFLNPKWWLSQKRKLSYACMMIPITSTFRFPRKDNWRIIKFAYS